MHGLQPQKTVQQLPEKKFRLLTVQELPCCKMSRETRGCPLRREWSCRALRDRQTGGQISDGWWTSHQATQREKGKAARVLLPHMTYTWEESGKQGAESEEQHHYRERE